ncbi:MAG: hypothetical protein M3163_00650 [Actinomycetota bacterium]|nr:hypothetical protein [Actinomycetota bacterium]
MFVGDQYLTATQLHHHGAQRAGIRRRHHRAADFRGRDDDPASEHFDHHTPIRTID